MSLYGDTIPGHVGVPSPLTTMKLHDVPEMNYKASEGKGEVGDYFQFLKPFSAEHLGRSNKAKTPINAEKLKCDGRTDRRMDRQSGV